MYVQIPGFPDYLINPNGVVVSLRGKRWKEMRQQLNKAGYFQVHITSPNGKKQTRTIHRLVLSAFEGPSSLIINHIDGVKTNNNLNNLEYCTYAHNSAHAWALGLNENVRLKVSQANTGQGNGRAKLSKEDVIRLLELKNTLTVREAAKLFGIGPTSVCDIWNGKQWSYLQGNQE